MINDVTTTQLLLYGLLGQIMPQVTDLLNKHVASKKIRFWASLLVCSVISLLFNAHRLMTGSLDAFLIDALVLWGSGQAAYKMYYEGSMQQLDIRHSSNPLPLKELIPDVSQITSRLPVLKK